MKIAVRFGIALVVVAIVGYAAVLGYIFWYQRDMEYDRSGRMFSLAETKLTGATEVKIPTTEGATLTGWYEAPRDGKPLILYFRGNAQSFSREYERYEAFEADGYGFLAFDYRGFPGSPGELNQANVLADGLAAFDWAAAKGFPIVLWGRSLGSGPASYVASVRDADALLLETPFLSAVAVAAARYPYLPVGLLMYDQYPVDQWITSVDEPVFVAHGTGDNTIPYTNGELVYALARNKDGIWIEPGADHGDLWADGLWERAKAFFGRAEATDVE